MEFHTLMLPTWVCRTCGRIYVAGLNNICMVCRANRVIEKEKTEQPSIRQHYRDLPQFPPTGRVYYEGSKDLDDYRE